MKKSRMVLAVAATAMLLAVSACSSTASPQAKTASDADYASIIQSDIEKLAGFENATPDLVVEPLSAKPPTGKSVDIINCAVPVCGLYTKAAEEAAAALGWTTKVLTTQFTPESYTATWTSVVQDKPDVLVVAAVLPSTLVQDQVAALHAAGTIILPYAGDAPAGPDTPYLYAAGGEAEQAQQGVVQGLIAIADAQESPDVLFLNVPSTPSAPPTGVALKEIVEEAGGSYDELAMNTEDIGTSAPGRVVSYLQSHPDVKYVMLPWDDWISGLPQALQSAGLTDVKIIGTAANETSVDVVESGQIFRSVVHPTAQNAWWMIDAAVRQMVGDPIADPNPPGPVAVVEPDNLDGIGNASSWPHIDDLFLTAWQVD